MLSSCQGACSYYRAIDCGRQKKTACECVTCVAKQQVYSLQEPGVNIVLRTAVVVISIVVIFNTFRHGLEAFLSRSRFDVTVSTYNPVLRYRLASLSPLLANVLRYVRYMLSAVRLLSVVCLSVCLLSVCLWRWCTLLRRLNFSAIFFTIR